MRRERVEERGGRKKEENNGSKEGSRKNGRYRMKRRRQQNLKKRPKNQFLKYSTSKFMSSERKQVRGLPMKKIWDYVIEVKKEFILRKGKISVIKGEKGSVRIQDSRL